MKSLISILAFFSFILWWGGFTFYAAFVIPTGQKVLGDHVLMGFITEQVAYKINITALVACLLSFTNEWIRSGEKISQMQRYAWICLTLMLLLIIASFILYPHLQALLNHETRQETDHAQFYFLHRIYLLLATALWINAIIYILYSCKEIFSYKGK